MARNFPLFSNYVCHRIFPDFGRCQLVVFESMGVNVHRDGGIGVAQSFLHHRDRCAFAQQL
jgi:hypothetical protein